MTTASQIYEERDAASVHTRLTVGGIPVTGVTRFRYTFARGEVPVLRVDLTAVPPAYVVEQAPVTFDVGLGSASGGPAGAVFLRRFTGTVDSVSSDEFGDYLECVGKSRAIEAPFQSFIYTVENVESNEVVRVILEDLAGVDDFDIDLPIWQIGTVAPQTIEHATFGAAVNKIATAFGRAPWKELPSGRIVVKQEDPIPAANAVWTYFSGQLAGNVESQPAGVTNGNARPRIFRITQAKFPREIRNKVTIIGAIVETVVGPDTNSDTIKATKSAPSPFIPTPPTYYDKEIECELIDVFFDAAASATGWLEALNRLETQVQIAVEGDPRIALGMTVQLISPDYARVSGNWFVESYSGELSDAGYETTMLLRGGQGAGSGGLVEPFADFTWTKQIQITPDGLRILVTFTSLAQDYDGTIAQWDWADDVVPPNTASGRVVTVAYDPADPDTPASVQMTHTVTDNDGLTDEVTKTVTIQSDTDPTLSDSQGQVTLGFIGSAQKNHGSATPDGGQTWEDLTKGEGDVGGDYISTDAWVRLDTSERIVLFGTADGELVRSTDDALTGTKVLSIAGGVGGGGGGTGGTTLTPSGPITVSSPGQIIEDVDIYAVGTPGVQVGGFDGVKVRNSRILVSGAAGIIGNGCNNLDIDDVEIINVGAPSTGPLPFGQNGIDLYGATGVTINRVKGSDVSTLVYANQCPGIACVDIEGHNIRGPYPRGQLIQYNNCDNGTINNFSCENDAAISWPEDNISLYQSDNCAVSNGVLIGNNSRTGVGVMFEQCNGGTCTNVDTVDMGNGSHFSSESHNIAFTNARGRDNHCGSQAGRGVPSSNALVFGAIGGSSNIDFINAKYFNLCNPGNIAFSTAEMDIEDFDEEDFTPIAALNLSFAWETGTPQPPPSPVATAQFLCIKHDEQRAGYVWAGTDDGRIYRSTDFGFTWGLFKQFPDSYPIWQIETPEGVLWAGGGDTSDQSSLIRVCYNKDAPNSDVYWFGWLLAGAPLSTAIALAGAGHSMKRFQFYDGFAVSIMFTSGVDPLVWFNADVVNDVDDWQPAVGLDSGLTAGHALASGVEPYDTVFVGDSADSYWTEDGINYTQEAASTPSQINHLLAERGLRHVYIGAADGGVVKTFDRGVTWGYVRPNASVPTTWPVGDIGYQVAFERFVGEQAISGEYTLLLIHRATTRTVRRLDPGPSWSDIDATPPSDARRLRWFPINDLVAYMVDNATYAVSTDHGATFGSGTTPASETECLDMREGPDGRLWSIWRNGSSEYRVYKSDDAGATWDEMYNPGSDYQFYSIAVHPTDANRIAVNGKNAPASLGARVHVSIDAGVSWIVRTPNAVGTQQSGEEFRPLLWLQTGRLICATLGLNGCVITYSNDDGASWTTGFSGAFTEAIADMIASVNYNPVFALLRTSGDGNDQHVLLRSTDLGASWNYVQSPSAGFGSGNWKSLALDPISNTVFVHRENAVAEEQQVWALSPVDSTDADDWTDITYDLPTIGALAGTFQKLVVVPKPT